ncbi:DNA polymerase III subunit beta [Shewanella algicola]|uniref:Beta sliding clamp n=1 Tax=Shewanella algicola TaxID=640633 RepID=A0A9X1Z576_9GAMM|nr:DNA polymerase III subunit beta [Shewanella algicola]MCL1106386.1 DNA polymerase III subunit beta [Shewanella algicola]GGP58715.1 DNA polymerase III subunit beta [Shewanella algicola]
MFTMSLDNKSRIQTICNHANSKINPIFELVLIEAKNDEVTFSASNGAQYNSLTLPAQVTTQTSFTLSGKRLSAVLNALSANNAKLEVKNQSLFMKSGRSNLKSPIFNASDYPSAPVIAKPIASIKCTIAQLAALFNSASYAVAKNDVRNYLCHVNLSIDNQIVTVCATDGHRLSRLEHTNLTCKGSGNYLVPTSLMSAVLSQNLDDKEVVLIEFDEQKAAITSRDTSIISVLGDGQYPDIARVIPSSKQHGVTFDLQELRATVKRFQAVASLEKAPIIRFDIDSEVNMSVFSSDKTNEFSEIIEAQLEDGEPISVGVNPIYLADALAKQTSETVTIYFNQKSAILITCDIIELVTLVMPIRV